MLLRFLMLCTTEFLIPRNSVIFQNFRLISDSRVTRFLYREMRVASLNTRISYREMRLLSHKKQDETGNLLLSSTVPWEFLHVHVQIPLALLIAPCSYNSHPISPKFLPSPPPLSPLPTSFLLPATESLHVLSLVKHS